MEHLNSISYDIIELIAFILLLALVFWNRLTKFVWSMSWSKWGTRLSDKNRYQLIMMESN